MSDEKSTEIHTGQVEDINALPDPDEGKTDEERRAAVCFILLYELPIRS